MKDNNETLYDYAFGDMAEHPPFFFVREATINAAVKLAETLDDQMAHDLTELPYPEMTVFEWSYQEWRVIASAREGKTSGGVEGIGLSIALTTQTDFLAGGRDLFEVRAHVEKKVGEDGTPAWQLSVEPGDTEDRSKANEGAARHAWSVIHLLCVLLNSPDIHERDYDDRKRVNKKRKRRGERQLCPVTFLRPSAALYEWSKLDAADTTYEENGEHWVRRHPHGYWMGKKGEERKLTVKMIGPFKRGNRQTGTKDARYSV